MFVVSNSQHSMNKLKLAVMLTLIALPAIAGPPAPTALFRQADGGYTQRSWCDGVSISVSGGSGGTGYAYVNAVIDAGSISVNNWPATQPVSLASVPTHGVTGTFWQATQPVSGTLTCNAGTGTLAVSAASLPLPTGAATAANLTTIGSQTTKLNDGVDTVAISATGALAVECVGGCGSPSTPVVYSYVTPMVVAGASKLFLDFYNGSAANVIKILGIYPHVKTDVAVTGAVSIRFDLYRTSAVGTGGTAASYKSATIDVAGGSIHPADTNNAALPAGVSARHLPTAGATISEWLRPFFCFTEETNAATYWCNGRFNLLDTGSWTMQTLTLRPNQGLLIKQGTVAALNQIGFTVVFSVE